MTKPLGRGLLQSLRARVDFDVRDLIRENKALGHQRRGRARRLLSVWIVGKPIAGLLAAYISFIAALILAEGAIQHFAPSFFPTNADVAFTKDFAGFLLTAQVALLTVLTVAIAVVTLLKSNDDGTSINPEIRMYYAESYSFELAASSILLSGAIVVQLFWPIEPLFPFIADGVSSVFRVCVTAFHAGWLVLNLYLLLHFINTSLEFVDPLSLARLRKTYSANEIIPGDVKRRLLFNYFANAPILFLGADAAKAGPHVTFGMGRPVADDPVSEISLKFSRQTRLVDVWLLPLSWAIRRWHLRVRAAHPPQDQFGERHWPGGLAVMTDFRTMHDDQFDLVLRTGDVPLDRLERWLIKLSFRFAKVDRREENLPRPTDFIEGLISKMVAQIEAGRPKAFEDAFNSAIDFHRFALEAQNAHDETGARVNLAEISDGFFGRPDFDWIREYRRAYSAATDKMTADGVFADRMSALVVRLWPRDPTSFPPTVLTNILELGRIQVATFEAWVTKRAVVATPDEAATPDLAGSDLRAYADALVQFVSSWETLEQLVVSTFDIRRAGREGDDAYWQSAGSSWPVLRTHMRNTAWFLAAGVWNEDLAGSARFRDLLVRWTQVFYPHMQNMFPFRDALMLTPDVLNGTWPDAEAAARRTLMFSRGPIAARTVFGLVLREAHLDAITIAGAVLLHWYATKQQPSSATAQTALLTLRRQVEAGAGSTLIQPAGNEKSVYRLVFDLLIREALHSPFEDATYSGYLDGLIRLLNGMATPRMIPGRIYGGFVLDGFQTLTPEFLAILAGNLPDQGDGGIADLMQRLLADQPQFQIDRTLRDVSYQFGQYASALQDEVDPRFAATVRCFIDDPDLGELRVRLKAILESVVHAMDSARAQRIREAPLDGAKIAQVRTVVTDALLGDRQPIGGFLPIPVERTDHAIEVREADWGVMDRGDFTSAAMSASTFGDLPSIFSEAAANFLRNIGWHEFHRRPKFTERVDIGNGPITFLRRVLEIANEPELRRTLGKELILLVPNVSVGNPIMMTTMGFPTDGLEELGLTSEPETDGGRGGTYAGTLQGMHIYIWPYADAAILCSRTLLTGLRLGNVRGLDEIFDFEFFDDGDPTKSRVRIWLAAEFEWEDRPYLQILFDDPSAEVEEH